MTIIADDTRTSSLSDQVVDDHLVAVAKTIERYLDLPEGKAQPMARLARLSVQLSDSQARQVTESVRLEEMLELPRNLHNATPTKRLFHLLDEVHRRDLAMKQELAILREQILKYTETEELPPSCGGLLGEVSIMNEHLAALINGESDTVKSDTVKSDTVKVEDADDREGVLEQTLEDHMDYYRKKILSCRPTETRKLAYLHTLLTALTYLFDGLDTEERVRFDEKQPLGTIAREESERRACAFEPDL